MSASEEGEELETFLPSTVSPEPKKTCERAWTRTLLGVMLTLLALAGILLHVIPALQTIHIPDDDVVEKTSRSEDLKYFVREKVLIGVTAKGGSTSFWVWAYLGMFGEPFNCSTYVQNLHSPCWHRRVKVLLDMSDEDRLAAAKSPDVLRVAIWRDPFDRIVSSFKSKFACDSARFHTDTNDRVRMVPQLREQAQLPAVPCLNITGFAATLDAIRLRAARGEFDLHELNPHIRPQQFYFESIAYDLILTPDDLSDPAKVKPITERFRFKKLVKGGAEHLHTSTGDEIKIPAQAARMLAEFAALTTSRPPSR